MKKLIFFFIVCLMTLSMNAQRCAVLEFKAGVGISQADVDGISAIFITYFRPAGYTMIERTQIDKAIEEQGFQRSRMTESQMVRIGKILNVSKIVIGDVNVVMKQYNVDVRVINVESGTIADTEGDTFSGTSYRETMKSIAQKLAQKIAIKPGETIKKDPQQNSLYVDLGLPSGTKWKQTNEKVFLTVDDAIRLYGDRLPTKEQFEELKNECEWEWTGNGFKFIGPNGKELILHAAGRVSGSNDQLGGVGEWGFYCTRSEHGKGPRGASQYYYLQFNGKSYDMEYTDGWYSTLSEYSVRLVK